LQCEEQKMEVRTIANRRMFLINLLNSDQFYNLTARAQAIYLQAIANADDEGFCDKIHSIRKRMHGRISDVDLLVEKGYLYRFSRDLYLIIHWRCHNHIRRDRGSETFHKAERNRVCICPDDTYHVLPPEMDTEAVRQYAAEHQMIPMTAFFFDRGGHTAVESKVMQSYVM